MKIYAEVLEEKALKQFQSAMSQPFVVDGALMPDAHVGYSLPIGAVVATDGVVCPSWVGYDIGCGMCALKLDGINPNDIRQHRDAIFDAIYKAVPTGFAINSRETEYSTDGLTDAGKEIAEKKKYKQALISLGGGNHFIELGEDENQNAWIVIHCGSRGVGYDIAEHHMKLAHPEGKAKDGHWGFAVDSAEGKNYIADLNWALDYALANRKGIMARVVNCITDSLGISDYELNLSELINRNHNHAVERDGLWIHRKGATHAELGMMGVIPGCMSEGSFIVRGKGNPESLYSSSHGAGRVLGRKEAQRQLDLATFENQMVGIKAPVEESTLDEAPGAYKDIHEVMALQSDLVEVVAHVKPIIVIKDRTKKTKKPKKG